MALGTEETMSQVTKLHSMVKHGDLVGMKALLEENRKLANSRSETDARGTYPLHVAAEFGQGDAARVLLEYGADVTLLDFENDAIALGWAAFFGRPEVVAILLEAESEPSQRNKHGLTPLGCDTRRLAKGGGHHSRVWRCGVRTARLFRSSADKFGEICKTEEDL